MKKAMLFSALALAAVALAGALQSLTGAPSAAAQGTAAPDATTGEATDIGQQTAKLAGTVNPNGSATTYTFQYGTSPSYGVQTTPVSAGSGTTASAVSATLTALAPGTLYHYRLVATNAHGQSTTGADRTFTTQTRTSRLRLFGHTAFVGPGAQVGVFSGCLGDRSCTGSLKMVSGGVVIGSRRFFFVRRNGGGIVHVPVNSAGRRKLAAATGGHLPTQVTVTSKSAGSDSASVTVVPFK